MIASMGDLRAMNSRTFTVKCGIALAVLITMAAWDNAQGRPRFEAGGSLNRDDRYPHTMDVRGWKEVGKKAAPFRTGRDHVRRSSVRPREVKERPSNLAGIVSPLAQKAAEIVSECGARVISGVRNTYVAGTHRKSLHAFGRAVDIAGPASCILAHLRNWPGGYSTDYAAVRHTHISYDPHGREWGARFAHGSHRHIRRVARAHRVTS